MKARKMQCIKELISMLINGKVCYEMICMGVNHVAVAVTATHAILPRNVLMVTFLLLAGGWAAGWLVILSRMLHHKTQPDERDILETLGYQF